MFSPAQKKLSEEGSSGSDAGSEVGPEPETDRFGFILTNGSTDGGVGPPPERVRQRETKWINIIGQWDRILLKKTSKVKVQCQKGIPASLRAKCWPLLCGAKDKMKQNENLYQSLDSKPALQSWVDVIERDLGRQFPFHEMFLSKDGHGQRGLFRVLKAYTQYQPEDGYCQAQGPVAAVLLMNMPAEEAFWCLVQISEQYLPGYYNPLLEGVLFDAAMLSWVLKRTSPAAHKHLQHHGVEPLMFATDWLMCLFTRHLPFNTLLRVWDLFFCYGVRVLLQVAVVLVRRVLGRAEQRKQCQGQMETLERLRGVRQEVREEDDAFIAEVCSVQLSARDLEKQTEKELAKWRKDRPSSTFDPRGRCQGYRMAWERARQSEEERDREEREKGNLSVPLARSASTLSLSPSLLHKRWRKGGKTNTREWEDGGGRVVRHLSMGAKEDWRSWSETHFKKVQRVPEEDVVLEERKKKSELKELLEESKKMPEEHVEEENAEEQIEQMEGRITGKEEKQVKVLSEQTEQREGPSEEQTVENILQPTEDKQEEELECNSQVKDTNKETEKQVEESENSHNETQEDADTDTNTEVGIQEHEEQIIQGELKSEESTGTENVQTQVETVTTETSPDSETDVKIEALTVKDPKIETETQQLLQDMVTDTDRSSQGDEFEGKYHSTESLAETDMTEESHTQTETEADELVETEEKVEEDEATQELEAEVVQIDSEQDIDSKTEDEMLTAWSPESTDLAADTETDELVETQEKVEEDDATEELEAEIVQIDSEQGIDSKTEAVCSPESSEQKESTDLAADTETEENDRATESREVFEMECDAAASEPTQQEEEGSLSVHSEAEVHNNQTQAEETATEAEITDSIPSPPEEGTLILTEAVNLITAEPDGKASSIETSEEPASEQPMSLSAVEEGESTENVQEDTVGGDDVFISAEPTESPNTDSNTQVQDKDSHLVKDQTEVDIRGPKQASGHRSSRSSGDLCVRKSSSSRLARRLSEDLFTMPEKTDHPEVKHSETISPPQSPSHGTSDASSSPMQEQLPPDPPKRFGLFRRLRGEQPKKTPKIQVPKILIQDFSDGTGMGKLVEEEGEEKLSSRERRRRRRERERREKEEERLRKKREKELGKERERERRKPQTRGKSFQVQREKGSSDVSQPAKTGSQKMRYSASYAESYF